MINIVPGLLVVAVSVVIAVAGLTLVQRIVPSQLRQQHNDVAGFIYAVPWRHLRCTDSAWWLLLSGRITPRQGTRLKGKLVSLTTSSGLLIRCQTLKDASFRNSLARMPRS